MEGTKIMETPYHVILLEDPEQKVFSIRRTIGVEQYHDFFNELFREAAARGLTQAGPIQMLYHDEEFNPEHSDVEAQMVVAQEALALPLNRPAPARRCSIEAPMRTCTWPTRPCVHGWESTPSTGCAVLPWTAISATPTTHPLTSWRQACCSRWNRYS